MQRRDGGENDIASIEAAVAQIDRQRIEAGAVDLAAVVGKRIVDAARSVVSEPGEPAHGRAAEGEAGRELRLTQERQALDARSRRLVRTPHNPHIGPDQAVIGTDHIASRPSGIGAADQAMTRIRTFRPEDTRALDRETGNRWQHIIKAQVADRTVLEVGGIGGRIPHLSRVDAALRAGGLGSALANRREARVDQRVVQELVHGAACAVAVNRVGVQITHDDEPLARAKTARAAIVINDVAIAAGRHVVAKETDFIMVATAVAILRAVENRWRWVCRQDVHCLALDLHRHVPVALGGERQQCQRLPRVPVGG